MYKDFTVNYSKPLSIFEIHKLHAQPLTNMLTEAYKRKPLSCLTNTPKKVQTEVFKSCQTDPCQLIPVLSTPEKSTESNVTFIYKPNIHY